MTGDRPFILFVCSGNTCRSPMAEALILHRLGPSAVRAGSAGLHAAEGCRASESAREVMLEMGVDISAHRSRAFRPELAGEADVIFAMTGGHRNAILSLCPGAKDKVFLMKSFSKTDGASDINDPAWASAELYRRTRDEIDEALLDVILYLKRRFRMNLPAAPRAPRQA